MRPDSKRQRYPMCCVLVALTLAAAESASVMPTRTTPSPSPAAAASTNVTATLPFCAPGYNLTNCRPCNNTYSDQFCHGIYFRLYLRTCTPDTDSHCDRCGDNYFLSPVDAGHCDECDTCPTGFEVLIPCTLTNSSVTCRKIQNSSDLNLPTTALGPTATTGTSGSNITITNATASAHMHAEPSTTSGHDRVTPKSPVTLFASLLNIYSYPSTKTGKTGKPANRPDTNKKTNNISTALVVSISGVTVLVGAAMVVFCLLRKPCKRKSGSFNVSKCENDELKACVASNGLKETSV